MPASGNRPDSLIETRVRQKLIAINRVLGCRMLSSSARPKPKQRLELKTKAGEACRDAQGQWTGCNWSTEWGQCKTDLKDVTEKPVAGPFASRYACYRLMVKNLVILSYGSFGDSATKNLNSTGEAEFSQSQVAAALALQNYDIAVGWLHSVASRCGRGSKTGWQSDIIYHACMVIPKQ